MHVNKMNAAVLVGNEDIRLTQVDCTPLQENQCRIKIMNVGVCSSDIQRGFDSGAYFYPLVMGHEMSGQVVETGKNVTQFVFGQRVVIFPLLPCFTCVSCQNNKFQQCSNYSYYGSREHGGYAEYLNVNEWNLLPIPDEVSYEDAAAVEPLSVVLHALKRIHIFDRTQPHSILILGAGFLGLLMAQILHLKSPLSQVTIIDRNEFKLDIAKDYVQQTILLKNHNDWDQYKKSMKDKLFDITVEATGIPTTFSYSIDLAAPNGTVLWMGNITDDLTISKKQVSSILRKELQLVGTWNSTYIPKVSDDWKEAINLIRDGVKPSNLITQWITLDEVPETLKKLSLHKRRIQQFASIKAMVKRSSP